MVPPGAAGDDLLLATINEYNVGSVAQREGEREREREEGGDLIVVVVVVVAACKSRGRGRGGKRDLKERVETGATDLMLYSLTVASNRLSPIVVAGGTMEG